MAKKEPNTGQTSENPVSAPAARPEPAIKAAIYLGPSVVENGVFFQHGKIFNNGLPKEWQAKTAAEPEFKLLLAPVARAAAAMAEMKDGGSFLAQAAAKVHANHIQRQQNDKGGQK